MTSSNADSSWILTLLDWPENEVRIPDDEGSVDGILLDTAGKSNVASSSSVGTMLEQAI